MRLFTCDTQLQILRSHFKDIHILNRKRRRRRRRRRRSMKAEEKEAKGEELKKLPGQNMNRDFERDEETGG